MTKGGSITINFPPVMNLYEVDFETEYVSGCCFIKAKDLREAKKIAKETITHTSEFTVQKVDMKKSGVVIYLSGDY
jgi:hypothetical protein